MRFVLAERLARTVGELEDSMTATEMDCWFALMEVEAHEAKRKRRQAGEKTV